MTTDTFTIVGLSGSLRAESFNTALLRESARLAPEDVAVDVVVPGDLPLFNTDLERAGLPESVVDLRARVAAADGLLVATPEYNFSVTGVVKNTIDWLSRGGPASPLHHKPTGLLSSAGGSGGSHALRHLRQILSHNRVRVLATPEVRVRRGSEHFIEGRLTTPEVAADIIALLSGLRALAGRDHDVPDVPGSVFVVGSEVRSADLIAALIAERGVRTLTALTRTDTGRLLEARSISAVVIDPALAPEDADLVAKDVREIAPGAPVVRPERIEGAADLVVTALRESIE